MSKDFSVEIKGLKELEDSLSALADEYGPKKAVQAIRPAVKAAMQGLDSEIAGTTPQDSGELKEATAIKIGKPNKDMLRSEYFSPNTVIAGRVGWFWSGPNMSMWSRSLAVEFGTEDDQEQQVLRNAFDRNEREMLEKFKKAIGPAIEKKAKALAKKGR